MVTLNPAPAAAYEKGKLYQIPITDFKPDPDQPRKVIDPDALAELAASITQLGVVQPLLFREAEQGWVYIVSGERRYQAAKQVGLLVLPAICVTGNHAEIALVENIQRQDLTVIEEAEAIQRLMNEQQYTQEQLGDILGKSRSSIGDSLSLMRLPPGDPRRSSGQSPVSQDPPPGNIPEDPAAGDAHRLHQAQGRAGQGIGCKRAEKGAPSAGGFPVSNDGQE